MQATAIISNADGRTRLQKTMFISKGNNCLPINISQLSAGAYFIVTTIADGSKMKMKFSKL